VNQESLIKGLSVLVAVLLVVFIIFTMYKVFWVSRSEAVPMDDVNKSVTLDSNEGLRSALDTLETTWEHKQKYYFNVKQDPLFLGRVIKDFTYTTKGNIESEEQSKLRLTATVIDENPKAIIKFMGKSQIVQEGDMLGNSYKVEKIEKKQVVLVNGGKKTVLVNKPLTTMENYRQDSEYSN